MTNLSTLSTPALVERFVEGEIAALKAYERRDIPSHNRWFRHSRAAAETLAERGERGRAEIESLLKHPSPSVRLAAAGEVLDWAPEKALPVLEDLLLWAKGDPGGLFSEAMHVQRGTEMLLAEQFGINILDVTDHVWKRRRAADARNRRYP